LRSLAILVAALPLLLAACADSTDAQANAAAPAKKFEPAAPNTGSRLPVPRNREIDPAAGASTQAAPH